MPVRSSVWYGFAGGSFAQDARSHGKENGDDTQCQQSIELQITGVAVAFHAFGYAPDSIGVIGVAGDHAGDVSGNGQPCADNAGDKACPAATAYAGRQAEHTCGQTRCGGDRREHCKCQTRVQLALDICRLKIEVVLTLVAQAQAAVEIKQCASVDGAHAPVVSLFPKRKVCAQQLRKTRHYLFSAACGTRCHLLKQKLQTGGELCLTALERSQLRLAVGKCVRAVSKLSLRSIELLLGIAQLALVFRNGLGAASSVALPCS